MNTDKNVITLLGTGNAHAMRCYNTCFTLCSSGGSVLLVDAGGGNGILNQMEKVNLWKKSCAFVYGVIEKCSIC